MRTELPMPEYRDASSTRGALRERARRRPRVARRDVGGVRQLSRRSRRSAAASGRCPSKATPKRPPTCARRTIPPRSATSRPASFATMSTPLKRGRDIEPRRHPRPAVRRGGQRIVREALLSGSGSDRPPLHVRLRGPRDRRRGRRRSIPRAGAEERAAGSICRRSRWPTARSRSTRRRRWRFERPAIPRACARQCATSSAARIRELPITDVQALIGHDRPGNVVAHGAGARARWLRNDRASSWRRIGIHGLLSFAVSQRTHGNRRAAGARRAVRRHPRDGA